MQWLSLFLQTTAFFELTALPKDAVGEVKDSSTEGKRGSGQAAIFVARNRFAVLNKTSQVSVCVPSLNSDS